MSISLTLPLSCSILQLDDFNLVFLSRPVSEDNLNLVTLNTDDDVPEIGGSVYVMGWGETNPSDDLQTLSDVLMDVEVKLISNEECTSSKCSIGGYDESYEDQITPNMLCAKIQNEDNCQGDSEGPLVVHGMNDVDVQVGVVSWVCVPSVFVRLYLVKVTHF